MHRTAAIFFVSGSIVQSPDLHRTDEISIMSRTEQTAYDHSRRDRTIVTVPSPEALSDGYEDTWKNSTIAVQSNRDRGAIEPRSWKFRRGIVATESNGGRLLTSTTIDAQSWPARGAIVARSWLKRWLFERKIEAEIITDLSRN